MAKFSASASSDRSALQLGYHPSNHGHPSPASRLDSQNDVRHAQLLPEAVRLDAVTTGLPNFAECPLHSAKDRFHSAKSLPSVTLGKRHSAKDPTAMLTLPSVGLRALGKALTLGKAATWRHPGPALFRVSNGRHSAQFEFLPSVRVRHSAKSPRQVAATCPLCRVLDFGTR